MPVGSVQMYAGSSAPSGWLLCDGASISRTTYASLFAVTNTTYGSGDGSTTFNLPNLRLRVVVGAGVGSYPLGSTGGSDTVTLTTNQIPSHTHSVTDPGHTHTFNSLTATNLTASQNTNDVRGGNGGAGWDVSSATGGSVGSATTGVSVGSTGGGQPVDKMPPYQVLNYIIKT